MKVTIGSHKYHYLYALKAACVFRTHITQRIDYEHPFHGLTWRPLYSPPVAAYHTEHRLPDLGVLTNLQKLNIMLIFDKYTRCWNISQVCLSLTVIYYSALISTF